MRLPGIQAFYDVVVQVKANYPEPGEGRLASQGQANVTQSDHEQIDRQFSLQIQDGSRERFPDRLPDVVQTS
jgi:hypothetical protein